jgi:hypothetical protein
MGNGERTTELTHSQVKTFKQCRRRYFFEYVEELKPVATPAALHLGTLYHYGLELLLSGKKQLQEIEDELILMQQANCEAAGVDYDPVPPGIAFCMVEAFDREIDWRKWRITAVEKKFNVSSGYGKRIVGKIDGLIDFVIDSNKMKFLLEHKTTSTWGVDGSAYLRNLMWDEQSTTYIYAYNEMHRRGELSGELVAGIFYNIVEKPTIRPHLATPVEKRVYKRDGSLYASQREYDETPEEYLARVKEWYLAKSRVHQHFVYRTPAQIAEHVADFNMTLHDINAAERDNTWYRNPMACSILSCPYAPKCLDNSPDTDCLFVKKSRKNEELQ